MRDFALPASPAEAARPVCRAFRATVFAISWGMAMRRAAIWPAMAWGSPLAICAAASRWVRWMRVSLGSELMWYSTPLAPTRGRCFQRAAAPPPRRRTCRADRGMPGRPASSDGENHSLTDLLRVHCDSTDRVRYAWRGVGGGGRWRPPPGPSAVPPMAVTVRRVGPGQAPCFHNDGRACGRMYATFFGESTAVAAIHGRRGTFCGITRHLLGLDG